MIEFNLMKKLRELEEQGLTSKEKLSKLKEFGETQEDKFQEYDIFGTLIDIETEVVKWMNQGQKVLVTISHLKKKLYNL